MTLPKLAEELRKVTMDSVQQKIQENCLTKFLLAKEELFKAARLGESSIKYYNMPEEIVQYFILAGLSVSKTIVEDTDCYLISWAPNN